jgi:hypothetical protein
VARRPLLLPLQDGLYRPQWEERAERDGQLWRGFLLFRNRMLAPPSGDEEIRAAQAQALSEAEADPASVDVMEGHAFVAHHSMPPEEAAAFLHRMHEQGTPCRL